MRELEWMGRAALDGTQRFFCRCVRGSAPRMAWRWRFREFRGVTVVTSAGRAECEVLLEQAVRNAHRLELVRRPALTDG